MRRLIVVTAAALLGSASWGQAPPSATPVAAGIQCTKLNANGRASVEALLTVNVNDQDVGSFDGGVYSNLETFMTPGPNTIRLTFSGPGDRMVNAELRCLRPDQTTSRNTILTLTPTANRLTAQTRVNYQPR